MKRKAETESDFKESPIFTGSTKYEPLPDVKNILITGGAGFMYVQSVELARSN